MNSIKEKKLPVLIALFQWFITTLLQVDRLFFTYDYESKYLLITKFLYLLFLLVVWCFIFGVVEKLKTGDKNWKRGFFVFQVYFAVMMCLLLILWPGTWTWDDLFVLHGISTYGEWSPWQHIITGAYQDVLLQILPFPGGIILLQNVIISLCVAFVVTKIEMIFEISQIRNKGLDIIIKLLPFLLPPVLMYQFSGYRIGLYVYIELVMLVMLIGAKNDKKEWNIRYLILFCVLCIIVGTWRTESFFYVPCACLSVFFIKNQVLSSKKKIWCIVILAIGFLGMNKFQNSTLGNANYKIISLLRQCAELVRAADYTEDAEELEDIDKVTSLEVIHNNPTMNGERLYWDTGVVRSGYTDEDYRAFLKAIIKLSMKYPKVIIAERGNLFIIGSGITGGSVTNVSGAAELFEAENGNWAASETLRKGWIAYAPVFKNIRREFIYVLNIWYVGILQRLVWNAIIPELILLYVWFKLLLKKKWYWLGICTAVWIRIPVVILTQPSAWFMYVLSFYFLGYVFLVYKVLGVWSDHKKETSKDT